MGPQYRLDSAVSTAQLRPDVLYEPYRRYHCCAFTRCQSNRLAAGDYLL